MKTSHDGTAVVPAASAGNRTHRLLPHTADAGVEATAGDLPALFEEAAVALAELGAGSGPGAPATVWEQVTLRAGDLPGLAYAWLNELIALGDIGHGVVAATVERLEPVDPNPPDVAGTPRWRLEARVGISRYGIDGRGASRGVKAATYHGLIVERTAGGWLLRAYLDL